MATLVALWLFSLPFTRTTRWPQFTSWAAVQKPGGRRSSVILPVLMFVVETNTGKPAPGPSGTSMHRPSGGFATLFTEMRVSTGLPVGPVSEGAVDSVLQPPANAASAAVRKLGRVRPVMG